MPESFNRGALTEATFYILLSLYKPNHGYGIMQFIEKETLGRVVLGPGTLYGAINKLCKKKWIEPLVSEDSGRKKEYIITRLGKEKVNLEIERLYEMYRTALKIVKKEDNNE